jgi:hypothetical protein
MRFSDEAKNVMLNALDESSADGITHLSLHTAGSSSGANEVTGGSPAYARQACAFGAAASGSKAMTGTETFDVPAGTTVGWIGGWDAVTAGDFKGMTPNGGGIPEAFTVPDISNDVLEAPGHGFSNGNTVVVWAVPGVALPTGLAEYTVYYVTNATTDDLTLSLTSGGATINITAVGSGFLQKIVLEVFGAQGTHTVSALSLTLN